MKIKEFFVLLSVKKKSQTVTRSGCLNYVAKNSPSKVSTQPTKQIYARYLQILTNETAYVQADMKTL